MSVFTGARIRDNNVFGTTTDNPLTNVATTLNSAGLANLSAVASNHAVLVLDPLRVAGAPEIVIVTAHTGAATSATITRGAYGTSARQHASGTLWVLAATTDDLIRIIANAAARPTDLYALQLLGRYDTKTYEFHNGTDYSPLQGGGTLGYAQVTANQTGITTAADLTSLSVPVTVGTGRRIKITGHCFQFTRTAGTVTYIDFRIAEGATLLNRTTLVCPNTYAGGSVEHVLSPSAGAHTYKLQAGTDGTITAEAAATSPLFILVEDIGV